MPTGAVIDWLLRLRPAGLLHAAGRQVLAAELLAQPALTAHPDRVEPLVARLAIAARTARADREAAVATTRPLLGEHLHRDSYVGELFAQVADATWGEASAGARHRLAEAAEGAGPYLGGAHQSRFVLRTFGQHGRPTQPWQIVADVSTEAINVIAWKAVGDKAEQLIRCDPPRAWAMARQVVAQALWLPLASLDQQARHAGIQWRISRVTMSAGPAEP